MNGFCATDVCPFPKFQDQLVGEPVEISVKKAESELQPCVVFTVKSAVGCANDFKLKNMQIHTHTMML